MWCHLKEELHEGWNEIRTAERAALVASFAVHLLVILLLGLLLLPQQPKPSELLISLTEAAGEEVDTGFEEIEMPVLSREQLAPSMPSVELAAAAAAAPSALPEPTIAGPLPSATADDVSPSQGAASRDGNGEIGDTPREADRAGMMGRLKRAGAKSGDVQISLFWNNVNDLDLHVQSPSGEVISYRKRRSRDGGELDVDMNVFGETRSPIENVYWPPGGAPAGEYVVAVDHYRNNGDRDPTMFQVRVLIDGKEHWIRRKAISRNQPTRIIYRFRYPASSTKTSGL